MHIQIRIEIQIQIHGTREDDVAMEKCNRIQGKTVSTGRVPSFLL